MKKRFSKIVLSLILFGSFLIITNSTSYGAVNYDKFDTDGIVRDLIAQGVGKNVGNELLSKGILSDEITTHSFNKFEVLFKRSGKFDFATVPIYGKSKEYLHAAAYNSADPYYKNMFDIYQSLTYEVKNSGLMDYYFKQAATYSGISDDDFARAIIETVVAELVNRRTLEVSKAFKIGCSGHYGSKGYKFTYNGQEYSCSDVYGEYTSTGQKFGPDEFYFDYSQGVSLNTRMMVATHAGSVSDTVSKHIQEDEHYLGSDANKERKERLYGKDATSESSEGHEQLKIKFEDINFNSGYMPNLANAIRFANESTKAEKLEFATSTEEKSSIIGVVTQMTVDFANYGVYVLYAIILFLGVKMIWSGVNGRVQFAETLPYLVVGIIFFYAAPGIIKSIQEAFGTQIDLENQASMIFGTIVEIVRVLSFAGIIFYGIKMMFSTFDRKVELKKSFVAIFIGCIIVFSASMVVDLALKSAKEAGLKTDTTIDEIKKYR